MGDEIDLREYLAVIRKRWKMIVVFAVVAALISFFNAYSQPKLYKATATLMTTDSGGGGLGSALSAFSMLGGGGGGGSIAEMKLTPIIKSRALAKEVAKGIDIKTVFPKLESNTKLSTEEKYSSIVGSLNGAIEARLGTSGLFEVTITWNDPKIAAELANQYVEGLGRFLNSHALNINFQLIDPAIASKIPFNRKTKQSAQMGFLAGMMAGIFTAFFLEYWQRVSRKN